MIYFTRDFDILRRWNDGSRRDTETVGERHSSSTVSTFSWTLRKGSDLTLTRWNFGSNGELRWKMANNGYTYSECRNNRIMYHERSSIGRIFVNRPGEKREWSGAAVRQCFTQTRAVWLSLGSRTRTSGVRNEGERIFFLTSLNWLRSRKHLYLLR